MSFDAVVVRPASPDLVLLSPSGKVVRSRPDANKLPARPTRTARPRRLPISLWRTESWTKKIVEEDVRSAPAAYKKKRNLHGR